MEKRIYNPLNEGYTGSKIDLEGYNGCKSTKGYSGNGSDAPSVISFPIISGVTNPNSNNNTTNSNTNNNQNSGK